MHPVQVILSRGTSLRAAQNHPVLRSQRVPTSPSFLPAPAGLRSVSITCFSRRSCPENPTTRGAGWPVGMSPQVSWVCPGSRPSLWRNRGGRRVADCLGTMGPSPVGWLPGPLTIGLGQALSRCPRPETDAQEPPVRAPELTSRAALSLRGRARSGREANNGGLMPGAGSPAWAEGSPGRAWPGRCSIVCGHGGPPRGLPAQRQDRHGAGEGALLLS